MSGPAQDKEMPAGRLRHRVRIEQPVLTPDGMGGSTKAWQELATVWAEIVAISSGEAVLAGKLTPRIARRFRLRYRADITAAMRLVYEGRVFNILSVINENEADAMLEILAEEGVAT